MLIIGHKIEKELEINSFLEIIKNYKVDNIFTTKHTFFRLNEQQRKVFKDEELKDYILHEVPIFVGIQFNGKYAVFYKSKSKNILRLILGIRYKDIEVVTFYVINEKTVPRI